MAGLSLMEFVKERRRAECGICALSDEVRAQIAGASDKKIKRPVVIDWLQKEHDVKVTEDDLARHVNARHDQR